MFKAGQDYEEALGFDDTSAKTMLALSRLHMASGDLDNATRHLTALLNLEGSNNDATVLLADVMFSQMKYKEATRNFQELLVREPTNYEGLSRLIDLMRRDGMLDFCPKFLEASEKATVNPATDPGLNYCQALYKLYTSQRVAALKHFNLARMDADWGVRALYNMVEIYLNPESTVAGSEVMNNSANNSASIAQNAQTASLLLDLLVKCGEGTTTRYTILKNYQIIAAGSKVLMEKAIDELIALSNNVSVFLFEYTLRMLIC